MACIVPLVKIPLNCFFRTQGHNNERLHALRRKAKLSDGYFLVQEEGDLKDTFPLIGSYVGNWRLGRIRQTPRQVETDYAVEIYRRSLNKKSPSGSMYRARLMDDHALASLLRNLSNDMNVEHSSSPFEIELGDTFEVLGFELN